jgi:hypothetical protein
MEDNDMKNTNIVNYSIVARNGKAMLMNHNANKYSVLEDNNGSTTMASIKILADLVSRLEQTEDTLNIIFIPRCLGGILRLNAVDEWIKNGNKTANGVQLSDDYVELVKYVTDMRKWLGTNNLILKMQGSDLIKPNEKIMIDKAWRQLDKLSAKNTSSVTRPASKGTNKPVIPSRVKAIAVDDIEL